MNKTDKLLGPQCTGNNTVDCPYWQGLLHKCEVCRLMGNKARWKRDKRTRGRERRSSKVQKKGETDKIGQARDEKEEGSSKQQIHQKHLCTAEWKIAPTMVWLQ